MYGRTSDDLVMRFRVGSADSNLGEYVHVVGDIPELGMWMPTS